MNSPLEGVRVLDVTQYQSGPSCTQMLAWLGADVIKIEEPDGGDRARVEMADRPGMDSFYFLVFNANKRSICLNLKSQEGKDILAALVRTSDVVVENLGPGTMERLGFGYEQTKEINPAMIYASLKGFGTYGPYAGFKSFEPIAQATSGALSTNGEAGGPPLINTPGVGDSGTGLHAAIGVLAAIRQRDQTGLGQYVEVSMQDGVLNLMRFMYIRTLAHDEPVPREGNRTGGGPWLVYPCWPGGPNDYVVMAIGGEAWDSLLAVIGRPDLIGDERYATREARMERPSEVEAIITEWTSARTKHEVWATLNEVGIPCGAVLDTMEVLEDPHLKAREMVVEVNDPERGSYRALGCPIKMSSNNVAVAPPPLLGMHTDEVLSTILDFDQEKLARLRDTGVIQSDNPCPP